MQTVPTDIGRSLQPVHSLWLLISTWWMIKNDKCCGTDRWSVKIPFLKCVTMFVNGREREEGGREGRGEGVRQIERGERDRQREKERKRERERERERGSQIENIHVDNGVCCISPNCKRWKPFSVLPSASPIGALLWLRFVATGPVTVHPLRPPDLPKMVGRQMLLGIDKHVLFGGAAIAVV